MSLFSLSSSLRLLLALVLILFRGTIASPLRAHCPA